MSNNAMEELSNAVSELSLKESTGKNDTSRLHTILNNLNAVDYKRNIITDYQIVFSLMKIIPSVIQTNELFLVSKSCKLFHRLLKKQPIPEKHTLSFCQWLLKCLYTGNDVVLLDILNCLHSILRTNIQNINQINEILIGPNSTLKRILQGDISFSDQSSKHNIELAALKCMEALTQPYYDQAKSKKFFLNDTQVIDYSKIAVNYLNKKCNKPQDEINHCEMLICACNILIQIFSNKPELEDHNIGDIIGACRCWMFYGLDGFQNLRPQKVMPSQQAIAEIPNPQNLSKGGKKLKLRKDKHSKPLINWNEKNNDNLNAHKNFNSSLESKYTSANIFTTQNDSSQINPWFITSESDVSDSESSRQARLKIIHTKTRLASLNLLTIIIRFSEKHVIFGYWWCLLPDGDNISSESKSLAKCIQSEPNAVCRTAAITAMLSLLNVSRNYLSQAETSKRAITSFTPFCVVLGHTLQNLHRILSNILSVERSISVLTTALKCTVACIQATPYSKMNNDLLSSIIENVKKLLHHKDWTVQVASLIVLGCIISIDPPVVDALKQLTSKHDIPSNYGNQKSTSNSKVREPNPEEEFNCDSDEYEEEICKEEISLTLESDIIPEDGKNVIQLTSDEIENMSWLVNLCFKNLGWTFKDGSLQRIPFALPPIRLECLQMLSAIALQHFELLLASYVKVLTRVLHYALKDSIMDNTLHAAKCVSSVGDGMQKIDENSNIVKSEDKLYFWVTLLSGSLTEVLQSEHNSPARMAGCDCISNIGEKTFVKLPDHLKLLCKTLLLGSSGDEDIQVCSVAVRALAVCIMYKEWREDPCLINDCGESILRVLQDPTPATRIKATWALANLTDAIVLNMDDPDNESVDKKLILLLLEESVVASKENDKIKMNVMRSIGNILFMLSDEQLQNDAKFISSSSQAIERLVYCASNGSNMKVRWNACYSLGKILKNNDLFKYHKKSPIVILKCLSGLIENCKNLKVKVHAAISLRSPKCRDEYGDFFSSCWKCLLCGLETAQYIGDYTEYKHKDNLIEQLSVTLAHLACLLTIEDLTEIFESTSFHWESAAKGLQQAAHKSGPQSRTSCQLLDAAKYVTTQLDCKTDLQTQCLNIIQNLFTWDLLGSN